MRAAVLINGECRELPIAIKSWKFLDEIDCDVYVSTWDKSIQKNPTLGINIEEDITKVYNRKYPPCSNINFTQRRL